MARAPRVHLAHSLATIVARSEPLGGGNLHRLIRASNSATAERAYANVLAQAKVRRGKLGHAQGSMR
jgi:hypothetical protein